MTLTATYSPDDNKLRLYSLTRLDAATYARVRGAGFVYAPKQGLFVAPAWTPAREDLLLELVGEIGDEDTSLVDRAEERAERFEDYSGKRAREADSAHAAVERITSGIPLGQPLLVGHHSERHARRDAERIENGMRKAIRLWDTSKYWQSRAAGALAHAKYKERPDVRARRIKGLETDQRREQKRIEKARGWIKLWALLDKPPKDGRRCDDELRRTRALSIANVSHVYLPEGDPRGWSVWSALDKGSMTPREAQRFSLKAEARVIASALRWLAHLANRLEYERAMLAESGYTPPPKPKTKADLPLLNYAGVVAYRNPYQRGEIIRGEAVGMTKAEWAAVNSDYKGTRLSECGTHRVRSGYIGHGGQRRLAVVYLTDSKQHPRPTAKEVAAALVAEEPAKPAATVANLAQRRPLATPSPEAQKFEALRETAKAGVQVAVAPQLFPTPHDLAQRMVELADLEPGLRVLEPSAGTGALLNAITTASLNIVAIERNVALADRLRETQGGGTEVRCADFLALNGELGKFDRVLMNPPFEKGADIKHVKHALGMLRPGGRLVAICANGPRQQEQLKPLASEWIDLDPETFKDSGTSVRTALLVIVARARDGRAAGPGQPARQAPRSGRR